MWDEIKVVIYLALAAVATMVCLILLFFGLPKVLRIIFRKPLGLHTWEYRNPYDRTCKVCNRHEVNYCLPGGNILNKPGWWEAHNDGDENAKPCGKPPSDSN